MNTETEVPNHEHLVRRFAEAPRPRQITVRPRSPHRCVTTAIARSEQLLASLVMRGSLASRAR